MTTREIERLRDLLAILGGEISGREWDGFDNDRLRGLVASLRDVLDVWVR